MSLGGELSENSDLYSLAKNATYFEIEPNDGRLMAENRVDDMPIFRKEWENIVIRNKPYQYKTDTSTKNKLYDAIIENNTTYTYFLKLTYGTKTVYGYFGEVDCEINEDHSLITVKPSVVDQYTDFIENYETEVDVFGESNLIKNGNFEIWTNNYPDNWNANTDEVVTRDTLLDKPCVVLSRNGSYNGFIYQSTNTIKANSTALINFMYAFVGVMYGEQRSDIICQIYIKVGATYYNLNKDGTWSSGFLPQVINLQTNKLPIEKEFVEEFYTFNVTTKPTPAEGQLTIRFFNETEYSGTYPFGAYSDVYITGVTVNASDITYIDLSVTLSSDDLVKISQESIPIVSDSFHFYPTFNAQVKRTDVRHISQYFNEDGSPKESLLDDNKHGPINELSQNYVDINTIFSPVPTGDEDSKFYLGEMCELHIAIGCKFSKGLTQYRNIHGWAKYAREEIWLADPSDGSDPVPPEEDVGWYNEGTKINGLRRWVRTPFNGAYSGESATWSLAESREVADDSDAFFVTLGTSEPIECIQYQYTVKEYPTSSNSQTIATGIDFRDICRKIYRSTHESRLGKEVYSAFFWNDSPYIDFLELEDGLNYYSMKQNFLNYIATVHTSSIKQITDPDLEATQLKMSYKQLFDDLQVKFPSLVWFVDTDMNLHFEHIRFIHRIRNYVDITTGALSYNVGNYKKYSFDTNELYGYITREDANSFYKDFKKSEEKFSKITTNKRRKDIKDEQATRFISTDIRGAIENPGDLGNGMILVAYTVNDSGDNEIITGTGQITGNDIANGVLATSYLLKEFGNYVGTWHSGTIDGQSVNYKFSQYCRVGDEIKLRGIIEENYLFTEIGMALVKEKKFDFENEETICTPVYRHIDFYLVADTNEVLQLESEVTDYLAN